MRDEASILHADLDAFFASVEQRDDPRLRKRPVLVGGGVVLAASYEAKAAGVRTPMGVAAARRICPAAVVVPPRMAAYQQASREVFAVFESTTPLVEPLSIDEAFLDVGGLRRIAGSPTQVAIRLRERVRAEVGLSITVGGATTKFLAKVASTEAKPDGLLVIPVGGETAFLGPLPVDRLWGVGPATARRLTSLGLRTVAQVAAAGEEVLVGLLGSAQGRHLCDLAANRDPRPVETHRLRKSVGAQRALSPAVGDPDQADVHLIALADTVAGRLRAGGHRGRTVSLALRFEDFRRITRSTTLRRSTDSTAEVLAAARGLITPAWAGVARGRRLTLVGLSVAGLDAPAAMFSGRPSPSEPWGRATEAGSGSPTAASTEAMVISHVAAQLGLDLGAGFGDSNEDNGEQQHLDRALDEVRARFGPRSIQRAVLMRPAAAVASMPTPEAAGRRPLADPRELSVLGEAWTGPSTAEPPIGASLEPSANGASEESHAPLHSTCPKRFRRRPNDYCD